MNTKEQIITDAETNFGFEISPNFNIDLCCHQEVCIETFEEEVQTQMEKQAKEKSKC